MEQIRTKRRGKLRCFIFYLKKMSNLFKNSIRLCSSRPMQFSKYLKAGSRLPIFNLSGRPRKGEYTGLTNREKGKLRHEKRKSKSNDFSNSERERKRKWRADMNKDQVAYEKYKENERLRNWAANKKKKANGANAHEFTNDSASSTPVSAFSCKQSLHRSLLRANLHLPKSPSKNAEIIQRLTTKYKIRIKLKENRGRPRKELSEEESIWLIEFLSRSDISYTNPGRKDNVYIGKSNGESRYLQRRYLLWPLRDILLMANGTEGIGYSYVSKFMEKLKFSQLCDFLKLHKEYVYTSNIPPHRVNAKFVKILRYLLEV